MPRAIVTTGVPIDYLMPGGLTVAELAELTGPLLASLALAGVSLACHNPQKDPDGSGAATVLELLRDLR